MKSACLNGGISTTKQGLKNWVRRSSLLLLLVAAFVAGCSSTSNLHGTWVGHGTSGGGTFTHRFDLEADDQFVYRKSTARGKRYKDVTGDWKYDPDRDLILFKSGESSFIGQLLGDERRFILMSIDSRYVRLFYVKQ
jgi:hypothetical protein